MSSTRTPKNPCPALQARLPLCVGKSSATAISGHITRGPTRVARVAQSISSNSSAIFRVAFGHFVAHFASKRPPCWSLCHAQDMCITRLVHLWPSLGLGEAPFRHREITLGCNSCSEPAHRLLGIVSKLVALHFGHHHNDDEFSPPSLTTVTAQRGNRSAQRR